MRKRWVPLLSVSLALVALVAGCRALGNDRQELFVESLVPRLFGRPDEEGAPFVASGTIHADEIRIASELGGRVIAIEARPGDPVQAGDLLVRLDDTALRTRQFEAEAAVAVAQADLDQVEVGPRPEEIAAARAMLALAQAQRDGYSAAWESALDVLENPQDLDARIAEARTQVRLAEQGTALAEAQLAREKLVRDQKREGSPERDIADWQVSAAEENLSAAQADLATAQTLLNRLWGIRSQPLALIAQANAAAGQVHIAEAALAVAQAQLDDLCDGPAPEEVAVAAQRVALERARVEAIRTQQAQFALTSPVDGIVLDQVLRIGELAAPAATILTVADLSHLTLVVYVPVNRLGHVQLGQPVQVAVDSFPDRLFPGHVSRIGDQPEYTPRNVATKEERLNTFYAVEIALDNAQGLLKPGMPADATF